MLFNLKTKSRENLQLSTYLNVFEDFNLKTKSRIFFFNSGRTSTCSTTQTSWTVQETHKRSALKLNFDQIGFQVLTDHHFLTLPWQDMGWMWQILSAGRFRRERGVGAGGQTGAKQIIGRLQVGKTIGQLD